MKKLLVSSLVLTFILAGAGFMLQNASAGHNGANIDIETLACGETVFTATIVDPAGTHKVGNMRLIVDVDGDVSVTDMIPTDGSSVGITVGPFTENQTILWRVFGGGERDYDQPLWNGYGSPTFNADINQYGTDHGWGWLTAGFDDPNPFTTWNELEVEGCLPLTAYDHVKVGGGIDGQGSKGKGGGKGSPTHSFDGLVADVDGTIMGEIVINYQELGEICTFTPNESSTFVITGNDPGIELNGLRANLNNFTGSCTSGAETDSAAIYLLDRDADSNRDAPRGAIVVRWNGSPTINDYEIDGTPGTTGVDSWKSLDRGNVHVVEQ